MAVPDLERPELETMVRELWDHDRIGRVPRRYSRGIDRRDWDLVRSCFAADAFVDGSRSAAPVDEYLTSLRQGVEYYPTTMHFMGNQLVEVHGDTGVVETYAVAFHWKHETAGTDHPENLVVGVRYHDTMARHGANWVITHRHVDPDWRVGAYPAT